MDKIDIIISPVTGGDGLQLDTDFRFSDEYFEGLDNRSRDWDLKLMDGRRHIGTARFSAYQFMSEGLERRTISLKNLRLEPRARNQGKSYDLMRFVLDTVTSECDREWGGVYGEPVVFIEKRHLTEDNEGGGLFDFLKKITERLVGVEPMRQPSGDRSVSVVGNNVSLGLIQKHLQRSGKARDRDPR